MKSIFGTVLLATLLTLAPSTAWSQPPQLAYTRPFGAVTDISGLVLNPGVMAALTPDGPPFNPCPPTVAYGQDAGFAPRQTGRDGMQTTADANPLNTGGRTEVSYASADAAGGYARAFVSGDTSPPCIVFDNGPIFMSAYGWATAQFYRAYTAVHNPTGSRVPLNWSLQGSFSTLADAPGGFASLQIYLFTEPPPQPVSGVPVINGSLALVAHVIDSQTWSGNVASCFLQNCPPAPKAKVITTGGTIDVLAAFEGATGRPMTTGDSFIIGAWLTIHSRACGPPDWCAEPAFTTDFGVSATIRSNVVFPAEGR